MNAVTEINKDMPSADDIARIRKRFDVEPEIDRALTDKLKNRAGPPYEPLGLDVLVEGVRKLIAAQVENQDFEIFDAAWMAGGASKLQMRFTVTGAGFESAPMVLRTDPAESLHATSRLREYQMTRALHAGGVLPVPSAHFVDPYSEHLPYPGIVYERISGVVKPSDAKSGVSGLGTHLPADLREQIAPQFVDHLARLHTFDFSSADLSAFAVPELGTQSAIWAVNWWDRVWAEDAVEESPLVSLASNWLKKNAPAVDHLSVVHGDFRTGNYLFDEDSRQITGWLDWELTRIGDRHQDLAWSTSHAFGVHDDGVMLVSGLMPEDQFISEYEKASGLTVDRTSLHYYQVFNAYAMVVMTLATAYRVARNGKSHQDVLLAWLLGVGYMLMDECRELIEKGP